MDTVPNTADRSEALEPRRMLALIVLADELPVPTSISLSPVADPRPVLGLHFAELGEAGLWAAWLGATETGLFTGASGAINFKHSNLEWHGWGVLLYAHVQAEGSPGLDADTRAALEQVADVTPEPAS